MEEDIMQKMLMRLEIAEIQIREMEARMREMELRMNELEERVDKMEETMNPTTGIIHLHSRGDVIVIYSVHHVPFAVAVFGADEWNDDD